MFKKLMNEHLRRFVLSLSVLRRFARAVYSAPFMLSRFSVNLLSHYHSPPQNSCPSTPTLADVYYSNGYFFRSSSFRSTQTINPELCVLNFWINLFIKKDSIPKPLKVLGQEYMFLTGSTQKLLQCEKIFSTN